MSDRRRRLGPVRFARVRFQRAVEGAQDATPVPEWPHARAKAKRRGTAARTEALFEHSGPSLVGSTTPATRTGVGPRA